MHANLALCISILQLIINSSNTQVELSPKYIRYKNEHRKWYKSYSIICPLLQLIVTVRITPKVQYALKVSNKLSSLE